MPNGNPEPSGPEVEALVRRSALLSAKVTSLVQDGFSRDEAMQILFADIEAGLTEFGTPAPTIGLGDPTGSIPPLNPIPPPLDFSTLVGSWNITPSPIRERCSRGGQFDHTFSSVEIAFVGQVQSGIALVFREENGTGVRAQGTVAKTGGSEFDFLGELDTSGIRLRLEGSVADDALEVTFRFQYQGTSFYSTTWYGSREYCGNHNHPRTLTRI